MKILKFSVNLRFLYKISAYFYVISMFAQNFNAATALFYDPLLFLPFKTMNS